MENSSVITIQNLVKRFPVGGNFFTACSIYSGEIPILRLTAEAAIILERLNSPMSVVSTKILVSPNIS